jgi:hypothetical protein
MEQRLPFGIHSLVPGLQKVPQLRASNKKVDEVPNFLRLSEASQEAMTLHIEKVKLDRRHFDYSVKDQGIF